MYTYGNSQGIHIPAPEIELHAAIPNNPSCTASVVSIVDTGAVKTCVPESFIERLRRDNLELDYRWAHATGPGGRIDVRVYTVDLKVGHTEFSDFEVIALSKSYGLIGRDILNAYRVILDGPNGSWEVDGWPG